MGRKLAEFQIAIAAISLSSIFCGLLATPPPQKKKSDQKSISFFQSFPFLLFEIFFIEHVYRIYSGQP